MKTLLFVLCTLALTSAQGQQLRTGDDVLRAMHDRYQSSWYETVTFTQKSTTYNADATTKVETWYEAAYLPGKLRIDIGPPSSGNGFVIDDGNVTIVKDDKVTATRPLVNMLLVFGFDVYRQPPQATIDLVKSQGYDLTKLREDTWDSHPVYIVGAEKGDLQSRQFWVEKDTLLFVREMEPAQNDPKKIEDIRFRDYRKLAGGWIAARVEVHAEVHSEDKLVFSEDYSDIQANVKLDPDIFNPNKFKSTHWEKP